MRHIEQARGCLPTATSSREAVIGERLFCFDWPRAYSLLLTPTAFKKTVNRLLLPVLLLRLRKRKRLLLRELLLLRESTATSKTDCENRLQKLNTKPTSTTDCHCNCDWNFKLRLQTADPATTRAACTSCTATCHFDHYDCSCFRYGYFDCWQPAVMHDAEGNRVDGLVVPSLHEKKYRSEAAHSIGGSEGDSRPSSPVCPHARGRHVSRRCSVRVAAAQRMRTIVAAEQHIGIGAVFDGRLTQFAERRDEALP
ncbi:hypothetical protein LMG24235_01729 [Paraburkholderia sabiae]|nr:hypothetical protein LMG24235_01729 [Paraburkholderia sabiae]